MSVTLAALSSYELLDLVKARLDLIERELTADQAELREVVRFCRRAVDLIEVHAD